ncbi:interleukin-12 subunit alpha [Cetorhinus maximus]
MTGGGGNPLNAPPLQCAEGALYIFTCSTTSVTRQTQSVQLNKQTCSWTVCSGEMMLLLEAAGRTPGLRKAVVFLAISLHLFCFSSGTPPEIDVGTCLNISKQLLEEVKDCLKLPDVTKGFNCTDNVIVLEDFTENLTSTAWTCSPLQESGRCEESGDSQGCRFSTNQCYQNITTDLQIYQAKLQNFSHITGNLSKHIQHLLKALNSDSTYEDTDIEDGSTKDDHGIEFPQRIVLCKILQAFKLRTITINRVMNYLNEPKF